MSSISRRLKHHLFYDEPESPAFFRWCLLPWYAPTIVLDELTQDKHECIHEGIGCGIYILIIILFIITAPFWLPCGICLGCIGSFTNEIHQYESESEFSTDEESR